MAVDEDDSEELLEVGPEEPTIQEVLDQERMAEKRPENWKLQEKNEKNPRESPQ